MKMLIAKVCVAALNDGSLAAIVTQVGICRLVASLATYFYSLVNGKLGIACSSVGHRAYAFFSAVRAETV